MTLFLSPAMTAARGVLQSSHERETDVLEEARRELQRTLSTERSTVESVKQQNEDLEQRVLPLNRASV